MSDENEKLQKLLRLKNYETPGEDYFDNFLDELKQRQRQDALQQSAVELLKERVTEWYQDLGSAKWAVPAGSFAAVAMAVFALNGRLAEEPISKTVLSSDEEDIKLEPKTFELQMPKTHSTPAGVPSRGGGAVLPAGFEGFREL